MKHRDGDHVQRTYDPAKTPFQRVRNASLVTGTERLDEIYRVLDPVRLLKQIGILQDALWKHAVLRKEEIPSANDAVEPTPEIRFEIKAVGLLPQNGESDKGKKVQKYHRAKEPRKPHAWRTRKDPFEFVWKEVAQLLETNPERTAKSVFQELQSKYPGWFSSGQLRTLQRRVQTWRAETILAFDDQHLREEKFGCELAAPGLKASANS